MYVSFKNSTKLAKYAHISTRISHLRVTKTQLAKKYWTMYDDFVTYKKSIDKTIFNKVVKEINEIESEIDRLTEKMRPNNTTDITHDGDSLQRTPKEIAKEFIAKRSEAKEDVSDWRSFWTILSPASPAAHDLIDVEIVKEPPPPKKKPTKKLSKETEQAITGNIKDLLASFVFKNKTECVSKQRTKPFYASKEEILEKIESNPEIKKLMPANYKKLTKDKLCEVFFATNVDSNGRNQ